MGIKPDYKLDFATFLVHRDELEGTKNELAYWGLRLVYRDLALNLKSPTSTGDSYDVFQKIFKDHSIDAGDNGSNWEYNPNVDYIHVYVDIARMMDYMTEVAGKYGSHQAIIDIRDSEAKDIGIALSLNNAETFNKYPDITPKII